METTNKADVHTFHSLTDSSHIPVLAAEVVRELALQPTDVVFDGTLGLGGHARILLEKIPNGHYIACDADALALATATDRLTQYENQTTLVLSNFQAVKKIIKTAGFQKVNAVLLDLGWGSHHLDSGRGFTFMKDEPLLMHYVSSDDAKPDLTAYTIDDAKPDLTAYTIINEWKKDSLISIFQGYGEEAFSEWIVNAIIDARTKKNISSTKELSSIICGAIPKRLQSKHIHPATKVFQALRIAVNDELGVLEHALADIPSCMEKGSKVAIITFHSIEDRIVKQTFLAWEEQGLGMRYHKKPTKPTEQEVSINKRARSAKLRTFTFL